MALFELEIKKNWFLGSNLGEPNWDNIRTPLLEWAFDTNRNFEQIAKDCLGTSYVYDNDGAANNAHPLSYYTTTAAVTGGTINGATIGATTPVPGTFTTVTISTATRYYSVGCADFIMAAGTDEQYRDTNNGVIENEANPYVSKQLVAPVNLPHGAIVTSVKAYFARDDALSTLTCSLERYGPYNTNAQMALCTSASTAGQHSVEDTTISNATIDNSAYQYLLLLTIDNNDATTDALCYSVVITYTITSPLP